MTGLGPDDTAFLDAMDGVAYLVAPDGTIVGVGEPRWTEFARANGRPAGIDAIGKNLFGMVLGPAVRRLQESMHEAVCSERQPLVSYRFRCDAPDRRRDMRLSIGAVLRGKKVVGALYQVQTISEVQRPWMSLFDPKAIVAYLRADDHLPLVTLCSVCARVAWPVGAGPETRTWIQPEAYYAAGGPSEVRVSHGLCPHCTAHFEAEVGWTA